MGGKGRGAFVWTILLIVAGKAAALHAAGAFSLVPVAYTGQAAPGTSGGATYGDLGSSSGPWPTIDKDGRVTFRGVLGFPSSGVEGLWNGTPPVQGNVVFEGQSTPDNPAQTFPFTDSFAFFLSQQRGGLLTYNGQYKNPDTSLGGATWLRLNDGTSTRILYHGMPLPAGTSPAGAVFASGRPLVYVAPDGGYAFRTTLQIGPGGVSNISNTGIWSQRNGALTLVARQGFQAPGAPPGVTFNGLGFPIAAAGGTTIFRSSTAVGSTGMWKSDGTTTSLVALTGQPAAGLPSGVLVSSLFNVQPHVNDSGNFTLFATLSGSGVTASNNHAIWLVDPGGMLHLTARSGTASPAGGNFTAFYGSPQLDNSNRVIFGGITSTYQGLFRSTPGGGLQTIAITGTQAPGNAPGTKFTSIDPPEANGAGWALFDADLTTAGGALLTDQLFAVDPAGIVSYVAGLGTFVDLGSGGVQEIRHAYRAAQGDTELTQLNDQNQAVFFATFTGVGSAVVEVNLPEPACTMLVAGIAVLFTLNYRRRRTGHC